MKNKKIFTKAMLKKMLAMEKQLNCEDVAEFEHKIWKLVKDKKENSLDIVAMMIIENKRIVSEFLAEKQENMRHTTKKDFILLSKVAIASLFAIHNLDNIIKELVKKNAVSQTDLLLSIKNARK